MLTTVTLLGASIFFISLCFHYQIKNRATHQSESKLLASFTERNPHPVLMLSAAGEILYANPSAYSHAKQIDQHEEHVEILLPQGINDKLASLKKSKRLEETWTYTVGARTLECAAYFLPDDDRFHLCIFDVTKRKKAEEDLIFFAYHDILTELPNRRSLQKQLQETLQSPVHADTRKALGLFGIDRFKTVTGSLGHEIGDKLLQAVSTRLSYLQRHADKSWGQVSVFRFESDVFALLAAGYSSRENLKKFAQSLLDEIHKPFYVETREFVLTLSCGISEISIDGQDSITLLRNAGTAMHQAKQQGGNTIKFYNPGMNRGAIEWLSLENYLRHALEHNELCLYYQPQIDVKTEKLIGMEALLRWHHPDRGLLTPDKFVPLAEESGIVNEISEWIIRTACLQNKAWQDAGLGELTVAINISTRQFFQPDLRKMVTCILKETGLQRHCLEIEITEIAAVQDLFRSQSILNELRETGICISIDDFGTGYSSLSYIKHFPVNKIKVDQLFIHDIVSDPYDGAITRAIITLGHSLSLTVVAEGVETKQQFDWLKQEGCDQIQGYIFSKPVPREEFEKLLLHARNKKGLAFSLPD